RLLHLNGDIALTTEFLDGLPGLLLIERLTMPALLVFQEGHATPFHGPCYDQRWLLQLLNCLRISFVNGRKVVPVNLDCVPAKGASAFGVSAAIPAQHRLSPLAQTVHVKDSDE